MARPTKTRPLRLPLTDPRAVLHPVFGYFKRKGTLVPKAECLPPYQRVGATDFARWMEGMMNGEGVAS